ncbi:MAG TPA: hypothetical protein VGD63_21980 [Steroidobacteraceae bacterium]
MRRAAANLLSALLLLAGVAFSAPPTERLVLIVSAESKVEQLDSLEVRKLFLGMTVEHNGTRLSALLNESDPVIKEVFLQNVVAMTETTYDRRLLQLALQHGALLPAVYTDNTRLLAAVVADPAAVSFAWYRDVAQDKKIKILRVLWHD